MANVELEKRTRNNILGDIRAERDADMLSRAFYRSHDYAKLIGSSDLNLVVGRRGTGKSALVWKLTKDWAEKPGTHLIQVTPEESQVQASRSIFSLFGSDFNRIRSASKIAWRYALMMEVITTLQFDKKISSPPSIQRHLQRWRSLYGSTSGKLRALLRALVNPVSDPNDRLGDLSHQLELNQLHDAMKDALQSSNKDIIILVDRLDEGYEPDEIGTAIVDGLVQAAIDFESYLPPARAYVFLRDNIFRAISRLDHDYSRNIEGQVMRLHWDETQLFGLVCNRLRAVFFPEITDDRTLWNRCSERGLQGIDGFKKCLQFTLYRPRDVVSLLNSAFIRAKESGRDQIVDSDIEFTAKTISETRRDDLVKEYESNFPGLSELIKAFGNSSPELDVPTSCQFLDTKMTLDAYPPAVQRHFELLGSSLEALRSLYGMGFVGIKNQSGNFVFCHDGKSPEREIISSDKLLIHPCYWMALNLTRSNLDAGEAAEIYDEYDIEVRQGTTKADDATEIQKKTIGQLMSELDRMPMGVQSADQFHDWCLKSLRILFAGSLRNIQKHPNANAVQRRDIVASNPSEASVWSRILDDYGTRQVIFEAKNFAGIGADEFRQGSSYLTGPYGKLMFIITRDDDFSLRHDTKELDWVKEIYNTQEHKLEQF